MHKLNYLSALLLRRNKTHSFKIVGEKYRQNEGKRRKKKKRRLLCPARSGLLVRAAGLLTLCLPTSCASPSSHHFPPLFLSFFFSLSNGALRLLCSFCRQWVSCGSPRLSALRSASGMCCFAIPEMAPRGPPPTFVSTYIL